MNVEFTKQDLEVLFEAVEKWESEDMAGEMMGMMLEGMIGERSPEAQLKFKLDREERERKRKIAQRQRKERGVLLRAKLVMLKDRVDANDFSASL